MSPFYSLNIAVSDSSASTGHPGAETGLGAATGHQPLSDIHPAAAPEQAIFNP